jgi:hypothetical protein
MSANRRLTGLGFGNANGLLDGPLSHRSVARVWKMFDVSVPRSGLNIMVIFVRETNVDEVRLMLSS